jgi:rfaE bifunctional protein nucleotidyltransferase chain/domain
LCLQGFGNDSACFHHATIKSGDEKTETLNAKSAKILPMDQAVDVAHTLRRQGVRLVFTNGCFDVLHPGHTRCLEEARKLGDRLLVAINSDRSVRALKGPGRPVFPENERAEILAALAAVDYVTIFDDLTPLSLIVRIQPPLLVKGATWGPDEIVGRAEVEAAGGQVVSVPVVESFSTSSLIQAALGIGFSNGQSSRIGF